MTVSEIRRLVYDRQDGYCLWCGKFVTWRQAHLHEKVTRGEGGKISLDNSIILCSNCHIGPKGAHGNRRPQFRGAKDAI
jgi:5-methylcytosine-specific restriction endonuclease McrA